MTPTDADEALPTRASQHPRISSLDGIRAFAVMSVTIAHVEFGRAFRSGNMRSLQQLASNKIGQLALVFFFVISGFLITLLLLGELDKKGEISLRRFYFRRAMRIIPPMYVYALVIALLVAFGPLRISSDNFIAALTFTRNYCWTCPGRGSWWFGHTWTLGVDAQFYLLWPAALAFGGRKRGAQIAVAFLIISPLIRFLQAEQLRHVTGAFFGLETVADAIALGCLLAMFRDRLHSTRWYLPLLGSRYFGAIPAATVLTQLLSASQRVIPARLFAALGIPLINVLVLLCLDWAVTFPSRPLGRLLNTRLIAWLGAMSYSIYLWHNLGLDPIVGGRLRVLIGVAVGVTGGVASYYLVEKPALRLRTWLEPRIFRPKPDGAANRVGSEAAA